MAEPQVRTCEWCRERPYATTVEIEPGRGTNKGYIKPKVLHLCTKCKPIVQRNLKPRRGETPEKFTIR